MGPNRLISRPSVAKATGFRGHGTGLDHGIGVDAKAIQGPAGFRPLQEPGSRLYIVLFESKMVASTGAGFFFHVFGGGGGAGMLWPYELIFRDPVVAILVRSLFLDELPQDSLGEVHVDLLVLHGGHRLHRLHQDAHQHIHHDERADEHEDDHQPKPRS